jgi:hypothetical protein
MAAISSQAKKVFITLLPLDLAPLLQTKSRHRGARVEGRMAVSSRE